MNFVEQLLKEHSRSNTEVIAKAIGNDPVKLKKIVDIIYDEKAPLPQRAAWLLVIVNEKYPELLNPYISRFINTVQDFRVDGVKKNMMHVLASKNIPDKLQGKLINICFTMMLSPVETVAVKVHAMQAIANVAKKHPEIQNELKAAIEDQLPKTTAAFNARAKRIIKAFNS